MRTICGLLCVIFLSSSVLGQEARAPKPVWPSADHVWTLTDYRNAERAFASIPVQNTPRSSDKQFQPIFARLTNVGNLEFLSDNSIPLGDRIATSAELLNLVNTINIRYVNLYLQDRSYVPETVALLNFVVLMTHQQLLLLEDFKKTLDKEDPAYASRMVGMAQTRYGASKMVLGVLQCLGERDTYTDAQRLELAKTLAKVFPAFVDHIDRDVSEALAILLKKTASSEPNPEIKRILMGTRSKS